MGEIADKTDRRPEASKMAMPDNASNPWGPHVQVSPANVGKSMTRSPSPVVAGGLLRCPGWPSGIKRYSPEPDSRPART